MIDKGKAVEEICRHYCQSVNYEIEVFDNESKDLKIYLDNIENGDDEARKKLMNSFKKLVRYSSKDIPRLFNYVLFEDPFHSIFNIENIYKFFDIFFNVGFELRHNGENTVLIYDDVDKTKTLTVDHFESIVEAMVLDNRS